MELMNVNEAAAYLGISPQTLYGWVFRGVISHQKIGRKILRFKKEDLDALVTSHPRNCEDVISKKKKFRAGKSISEDSVTRMVAAAKKEVGVN